MVPRFFLPCFHGLRASRLGHKRKEKTRSITCRTDRANEANKRYVLPNIQRVIKVDIALKNPN